MNITWNNHLNNINKIRNIFLTVDTLYAANTPGVLNIKDVGFTLFRKYLSIDTIEGHNSLLNRL
jgi:hypothetical protein